MDEASPTSPAVAEAPEPGPLPIDRGDVRSAIWMGVLFVGSILLALVLADALQGEVEPVFEDPDSIANPLIYLGIVVLFTLVILAIAKFGGKRIIQAIILSAVFFTMWYVFQPILTHYVPGIGLFAHLIAGVVGGVLTALLYWYPEWYVVDAAGVSVAAGATGIFGFSFGIIPALVLLVGFAIYDFIAVYRTKHMLDLADTVMDLRLPVMLVVPKVRGYSFLEGERLHKDKDAAGEDEGRDALFMGLGDIVIPGVLIVSSFVFLQDHTSTMATVAGLAPAVFVSLATLVGATLGFVVLMWNVLKGKAHAGLPALNGGALLFFFATTLWLYGTAPLIPKF